ncbi:MAG: hypothetical protein KatS3mg021_2613 [Fimbriimonadales bacterium]|nr:MAG: hypothetical protein KatS3mg021_2613 [Fimbriimonadales bacterium]
MRLVAHNHLIVASCEGQKAHEVRHNPAGHKERRLFAHSRGGKLLQLAHGGVIAQHIVADLRLRHRAAHLWRRLRDCVRAQVYQPVCFAHHSTPL